MLALIATGIAASILHLPTLASLWETGYGQALLVKIALLLAALLLAAVNLLRTPPAAARRARGEPAAPAVAGEVVLLAGAVFAAAVLTSLAPPAKAVAELGKPLATVGPGPWPRRVERNGYTLRLASRPTSAAANNRFEVTLTKDGRPVRARR